MQHDHRRLAVEFNQRTWHLLDNKQRSPQETEEMIVAAHASHAHWLKAGTGVNHQRGQWLIARVYAELGHLAPALHHLRQMQRLTERYRDELADFDFAFAEALAARISALAGDHDEAAIEYANAKRLGEALANAEDRRIFFEQLHEGPWFGLDP